MSENVSVGMIRRSFRVTSRAASSARAQALKEVAERAAPSLPTAVSELMQEHGFSECEARYFLRLQRGEQ